MRFFTFLMICVLSVGLSCVKAQHTVIDFDVIYNGKSIGTLKATKEKEDSKIIKNLRSNTDAKIMMISIHVESEVKVHTEGEIMTSATSYRHANRGTEDIQTTTVKDPSNSYTIVKNGETISLTHAGIKTCVIDLYFQEPLGVTSVFSSTYGTFVPLKYISKGVYKITLPDGKSTTFTYVGGKLTQAVATLSLGDLLFKRK